MASAEARDRGKRKGSCVASKAVSSEAKWTGGRRDLCLRVSTSFKCCGLETRLPPPLRLSYPTTRVPAGGVTSAPPSPQLVTSALSRWKQRLAASCVGNIILIFVTNRECVCTQTRMSQLMRRRVEMEREWVKLHRNEEATMCLDLVEATNNEESEGTFISEWPNRNHFRTQWNEGKNWKLIHLNRTNRTTQWRSKRISSEQKKVESL